MKESYEWVLACIKSCTNPFQLESAKVLLQLFKIKYESERLLISMLQDEIIKMEIFLSVDA